MTLQLFYGNGGGASRYDAIAQQHGWLIGCHSGGRNIPRQKLHLIDNNWVADEHQKHLSWI